MTTSSDTMIININRVNISVMIDVLEHVHKKWIEIKKCV